MTEQWKEIEDFPNYMISDKGRVWSKTRVIHHKDRTKIAKGKILKNALNSCGYFVVVLCTDGKTKTQLIHRLIAEHFIDNSLNKKCVNHIDGNKTNNKLSNLEWVTYSENNKHAYSTKLKLPSKQKLGSKHINSKIDEEDVLEIRRKHKYESLGYKKLSDEYGISISQIARIVKYKSWKHVGKGV